MRGAWERIAIANTLIWVLTGVGFRSAQAQANGTANILPTTPGMYVQSGGDYAAVIGQIAQFTRTGSRFVSTATAGIKSAKANVQLAGPHAQVIVSPQPVFYFIPPQQELAAGVNAGDFILIRLEEKPKRRQFEIAAVGLFRASTGISLTHQIQILRSEPKPGVFMITPAMELNRGEYALYLSRGEGMQAYVYDFGVQGARSTPMLRENRPDAAPNASEAPPRSPEVSSNNLPAVNATASKRHTSTPVVVSQESSVNAVPDSPSKLNSATSQGGVLGITGFDWERDGTRGVEVVDVFDGSSGQLAGLHKGYVVTEINGAHVRSTQELVDILARLEPGTRVTIAYLYKSNLGWMPKEAVAILSK